MAYTYDALFAVDPNSPNNIARNASILLFDPNDPTKTPVTLTDVTDSPVPNPIQVNQHGFGPAIKHQTLDRLAWEGAGMSGVFTSYEGLKEEAVAAREAAEVAAGDAAAAAQADLEARIASGVFKGDKGADGANVLPTDAAIKNAITTPGTETATALSATIETEVSTVVSDPAGPVTAKFNAEKATKAKLVNLVFDGDSLTWGHSSKGGMTYPRQAAEGIYATVYNFGVSGQSSTQMLSDAVTQVDGVYEAGKQNFVFAMIGTNDILTGGSPTTTYNNIKAYHDGRRAAGFKTLAFTITPRTGGTDDAGHNTRRTAINDLIRANWQTFADALVDVAADPIIGNVANTTNTTYFSDQTHFTNAGYAIIAKLTRAELRKLGIDGMHDHYGYAPKRDSIFVSAAAFTPRGTITSTINNATGIAPFWNMKDGVDEVVLASVELPANWDFYRAEILWANAGAVAGDVRWGLTPYRLILGANAASADAEKALVVTAGAQNTLVTANGFWTGSASQAIDKTTIAHVFGVTRRGSAAQDTLAADARFYGLRITNFDASGPSLT